MSLAINQHKITRVLLADGWHECQRFGTDSYEFGAYYWDHEWGLDGAPRFDLVHGGGQSGVCATGFAFTDAATGEQIAGPLTAVLAVAGPGICSDPACDDPHVAGRPAARP
jgi:hypothetical protein